jgi:hypothetical protein
MNETEAVWARRLASALGILLSIPLAGFTLFLWLILTLYTPVGLLEDPMLYGVIGIPLLVLPLPVGVWVGWRFPKVPLPELIVIPLAGAGYIIAAVTLFGLFYWGPLCLLAVGYGLGNCARNVSTWRAGHGDRGQEAQMRFTVKPGEWPGAIRRLVRWLTTKPSAWPDVKASLSQEGEARAGQE